MARARDMLQPGAHKVRGTTYVHSKVLRIGRLDERHAYRGRISVDGRPLDLPIGELDTAPFFDAAKRDATVRLKLQAEWMHAPGQLSVLCKAVVFGIDEASPGSGARILALAKGYQIITADELPAMMAAIEQSRMGDERLRR